MRQLHELDIHIAFDIRSTIVQRQQAVDAAHRAQQFEQGRLRTQGHLRDLLAERAQQADELNRIAEPVITVDQHPLAGQRPPIPEELQMSRPAAAVFALRDALLQNAIAHYPRRGEVATPDMHHPGICILLAFQKGMPWLPSGSCKRAANVAPISAKLVRRPSERHTTCGPNASTGMHSRV